MTRNAIRPHVAAVAVGGLLVVALAGCGGGASGQATSVGCFGRAPEPATGQRYVATYASVLGPAPIDAGTRTVDVTVTGPTTFQSRAAIAVRTVESSLVTSHIMAARFRADTDRLDYVTGSGPGFARLGSVARIQSSSTIQGTPGASDDRVTELEPAPWRDPAWSLTEGETASQAHTTQVIVETLSSSGAPVRSGNTAPNWNREVTWQGSETIAVAAGTYEACRFAFRDLATGVETTQWLLPGYGILLKWVSDGRSEEATRLEIDGQVR